MSTVKLYFQKIVASIKGDKARKKELTKLIRRSKCKLGVTYNVFDGLELLEASIQSVRNNVDYITVVYQEISNFGEHNNEGLPLLLSLKERGLIDNILFYTPNLNLDPQENEVKKRHLGLKDCLKHQCSYFLNMDTDEFYLEEQFQKAKEFICDHQITSSACSLYNYVKRPIYRFTEPTRTYYVPFICKINRFSKIIAGAKTFCRVDPTRMVKDKQKRQWMFAPQALTMHHMSFVRKDLEQKFRNSTCNRTEELKKIVDSLREKVLNYQYPDDIYLPNDGVYKIEQVDDLFNIEKSLSD